MYLQTESFVKMTQQAVCNLLADFDMNFSPPLSSTIDLTEYSQKLSTNARFIIVYDEGKVVGFISFYLNNEEKMIYIPLISVKRDGYQHKGIGQLMFEILKNSAKRSFYSIRLEVLKNNAQAVKFYCMQGFKVIEDRDDKRLMSLELL